ncbi:MAG: class I SAM-dependent methyltransferase [Armatimonadota bacterium]
MRPLEDTEAAWVTEYFGDEYLRLYQFPADRTDPEVTFLAAELAARIPPSGRVLDLACGQGRHAIPLAARGFQVTGLDYQQNLLQAATRRAREEGVTLSFVRGDMRCLPFTGKFDAVLNIFSAFGYFSDEENARVLREMARVLRPGGWLILDVANRDAMLRRAEPRSWKRLPDGTPVISEWTWDVRTGRYTHWQLLVDGNAPRSYTHSVRVYTYTELDWLLHQAGLTIDAVHGGFRGEELTWDAPRMVLIVKKILQIAN